MAFREWMTRAGDGVATPPVNSEAAMTNDPDHFDPGHFDPGHFDDDAAAGGAAIAPSADITPIRSPLVHELYRYWNAKRGGRTMPRKSDIDPAEIKPLLPYILIGEFAGDPVRLRYRLVGTEVVSVYGIDFTGRWLDELDFGDQVEHGWALQYRAVFHSRQPIYGSARLLATSGMEMPYEFGLFPLSQDGDIPTHCLDLNDYRPALRRAEERWMKIQILQNAEGRPPLS